MTILENLNQVFMSLFNSIDKEVFIYLDALVFANSNIIKDEITERLIGNKYTSGTISIAIAISVGFILYYAIRYLLSHLVFKEVENPFQFILKIILTLFVVVYIKDILNFAFYINHIITEEILRMGEDIIGTKVTFMNFLDILNSTIYSNDIKFEIATFDGIIKIFVTVGIINLLFEYTLRYVLLKSMCIISPFLILFRVFKGSSYIYKNWMKIFFSMLFMQNIVAIILVITTLIKGDMKGTLSKLIFVGTVYALIKANKIVNDIIGGINMQNSLTIQTLIRGG